MRRISINVIFPIFASYLYRCLSVFSSVSIWRSFFFILFEELCITLSACLSASLVSSQCDFNSMYLYKLPISEPSVISSVDVGRYMSGVLCWPTCFLTPSLPSYVRHNYRLSICRWSVSKDENDKCVRRWIFRKKNKKFKTVFEVIEKWNWHEHMCILQLSYIKKW